MRAGQVKGKAVRKPNAPKAVHVAGGPARGGTLRQPSGLRTARAFPAAGAELRRGPRRPEPALGTRRPFRAALTSATAASRSAPRSVTGSCRRARATAAGMGSRRVDGRHGGRQGCANERGVLRRPPGSASDT